MRTGKRKTIKGRWIQNILAVTVTILLFLACAILYSVYTRYITTAELSIRARISSTVDNYFSNYNNNGDNHFSIGANEYVKNFAYKDIMEVLVLDKSGKTIVSSNAFGASSTVDNRDYEEALLNESRIGVSTNKTLNGEPVLALSYILLNQSGEKYAALRYLVSLEDAFSQFKIITVIVVLLFSLIILLISLLGRYFVSSIVQPIEKINQITKVIAKGDFSVRIENDSDDEIGELSESINEMAGKLNETDKMKNDFISTVSHEIRTPLTAIKGWGETLKAINNDPQLAEKGLDIIISETERLSDMVEELLDFSRIQNADLKMNFDVFRLDKLIQDVFVSYKQRAENENKTFISEIEIQKDLYIRGDEAKIRQVLINIIDNALKYTDENAVIKIRLERNQKYVTIYLDDTGKGIAPKDLPYIKDKFYKADSTVRGTGIGLAVADEIIKKHSGKLNIKSEIGKGTCVEIILPIYFAEE